MADYRALREEAHESHEARQRRFGGGVSDDEAQDKKMIAAAVHKHERHDHPSEKETKLKRGGDIEGRAAGGRRLDRKGKKGHTTVNIVMGGGGQANPQEAQQAHQAGMQQGAMLGAKMAAAKLAGAGGAPGGAGGPPPGMVPPGAGPMPPGAGMPPPRPPVAMGPPQGGPPMIPGRKRGGRALGTKMTAGAGSGEGRLEKEELAEQEMR